MCRIYHIAYNLTHTALLHARFTDGNDCDHTGRRFSLSRNVHPDHTPPEVLLCDESRSCDAHIVVRVANQNASLLNFAHGAVVVVVVLYGKT